MNRIMTLYYFVRCILFVLTFKFCGFAFSLQDVLNNLGSSELDEDDLMLDLDLSDDQRHRHGNFISSHLEVFMSSVWVNHTTGHEKIQMVQMFTSNKLIF